MARYFFHAHDGQNIRDDVGQELPDVHAARRHAVRYAGCLIAEFGRDSATIDDWKMDVCDERGLILFSLLFFGIDGAISLAGPAEHPARRARPYRLSEMPEPADAVSGSARG